MQRIHTRRVQQSGLSLRAFQASVAMNKNANPWVVIAIHLYREVGCSLGQVATAVHRSRSRVHQVLIAEGVERRGRNEQVRKRERVCRSCGAPVSRAGTQCRSCYRSKRQFNSVLHAALQSLVAGYSYSKALQLTGMDAKTAQYKAYSFRSWVNRSGYAGLVSASVRVDCRRCYKEFLTARQGRMTYTCYECQGIGAPVVVFKRPR